MTTKKPARRLVTVTETTPAGVNPVKTKKTPQLIMPEPPPRLTYGSLTIEGHTFATPKELHQIIVEAVPHIAESLGKRIGHIETLPDGSARLDVGLPLTVDIALDLLRTNYHNRDLNWSHVAHLVEVRRRAKAAKDGWKDDVSTFLLAVVSQDYAERFNGPALVLADGQHRTIAEVLYRGTWAQIQMMMHFLTVCAHNRAHQGEAKEQMNFDKVKLSNPKDSPRGLIYELPIADWLTLITDDPNHPECYEVPIDGFVPQTIPEEIANDSRRYGVRIGVSAETFGVADQNLKMRDGGDFISLDPELGNEIAAHGITPKDAALFTRSLGIRFKIPQIVKDEATKTESTKRGSLLDGNKWKSPPAYPDYYRAFRQHIVTGWDSWDSVAEYLSPEDAETGLTDCEMPNPSRITHPAHKAYTACTTAPVKGAEAKENAKKLALPVVACRIALALIDPATFTSVEQYEIAVSDLALRLRLGLYIATDEDGAEDFAPDDVFEGVRKWNRDLVTVGGSAKSEEIINRIATAAAPYLANTYPGGRLADFADGRFAGLDSDGLTVQLAAFLGETHPDAEKRPAGRPKGSTKKAKA